MIVLVATVCSVWSWNLTWWASKTTSLVLVKPLNWLSVWFEATKAASKGFETSYDKGHTVTFKATEETFQCRFDKNPLRLYIQLLLVVLTDVRIIQTTTLTSTMPTPNIVRDSR